MSGYVGEDKHDARDDGYVVEDVGGAVGDVGQSVVCVYHLTFISLSV